MKPEILAIARIHPPTQAALEREFTVYKLWAATDPDMLLHEVAARVRAVVTNGPTGCSRAQMEALPRLELIACFGTPYDAVDLAAAKARGVIVTNTPDSITESVGDVAIGLIIAAMRRVCETDRYLRAGKWQAALPPLGRELGGKTCGIVGLGAIGRAIARRAIACGMSVCYQGPRPKADVTWPYVPDLKALAERSDCLVVACADTPATRGMINAPILDALGKDGFLVNIARGPIVDQAALIDALRDKRIAGAGLDVYWDEPNVPEALIGMDNVVLTPHIGSSTLEVREARGVKLLENLRAHFGGKPVPHPFTGRGATGQS